MDLLSSQVEVYAAKKSPADKARHSVLQTLAAVAAVYERMSRTLKDKGELNDFLDKCISGKPVLLRELLEIVEKGEACKTQLKAAKEAEKRKEERALARKEAAAKAAEIPLAATATNTVTNVVINIGSALMSALAATVPPPTAAATVTTATTVTAKPKAYKKRKIGAGLKEALWHKVCGDECVKIKCPVCQIRDLREKDFVAGHIDAERDGGETSIDNLIPICNKCNSCMATRNMMDYCRETYKRDLVLPVVKN
jgi:hypothetical protein